MRSIRSVHGRILLALATTMAGLPGALAAQDFVASPPEYILTTQLRTGNVSHVTLICVDAGGGRPLVGGCSPNPRDDVPTWRVRRCDADGCEFEYPMTLDSETKIHFPSGTAGVYYVTYWNGQTGENLRVASTSVHGGPLVFPPPITP